MITDTQLLNAIRQTTMMGRIGIDAVIRHSGCQPMTDALRQQRAEYSEILDTATKMLAERGGQPEPLPLGARMGTAMSRVKNNLAPPSTSKIADQMITGNTKGVIKSIQHHRQYMGKDERITDLSKKLLETEDRNIQQMKPFL